MATVQVKPHYKTLTYCLWFSVFGEAKGLRSAAMRTSCLLPLPGLTPRTLASGVLRPLDPGVRPGVAVDLGVRRGVVARPGVRLGVREEDGPASSPSHTRPGVSTKHSSRENSLVLCSFCGKDDHSKENKHKFCLIIMCLNRRVKPHRALT